MYVATTRLVRRIDLSGFVGPTHPAIVAVTPEHRKAKCLSGGVTAQIDFARPTVEILDAVRLALDAVAGKVVVENVVMRKATARRPLALTGYVEPAERAQVLRFFADVVIAALGASGAHSTNVHLEYILDKCIWGVTTYSDVHKYNTRYLSEEVYDLVVEWEKCVSEGRAFARPGYPQKNFKLFTKLVRHEHVVTRAALGALLVKEGRPAVEQLLSTADACLVTREEERALNRATGSGWARYEAEGISVWDRATGALRSVVGVREVVLDKGVVGEATE
jgi:hypothetical protein